MDGNLLRYNKNIKYAIIDTETFNLNLSYEFNRPWGLSLIKRRGNSILEENDYAIDWSKASPHLEISKGAALVTRFNLEEHLKIAKQPEEVFDKIYDDLQEANFIIGHNLIRYDLYLLRIYCMYMKRDWKFIVPKMIDTKAIAQGIKMGIPYTPKQGDFLEYQYRFANAHVKNIKTSMNTLCKEFGFPMDEGRSHGSLYDCQQLIKLWDVLKFQIEK